MNTPTPTALYAGSTLVWQTRFARLGMTVADTAAIAALGYDGTVHLDRTALRGAFVARIGDNVGKGATPVDAIRAAVR